MTFQIAPKETELRTNWGNARMYCFSLSIEGKVGWRLPTIEELNVICKSENDFEHDYCWSSTEFYDISVLVQYFHKGDQYFQCGDDKNAGVNYVRAVRSID